MSHTKEIPPALCPLPWMHLATHPNGAVSLCCRINYADDEGFAESSHKQKVNLNQDSIASALNSPSFKQTRLEMLAGKWPKACEGCRRSEKDGLESKRLYESRRFNTDFESLRRQTSADGGLLEAKLEFIELRLGNKCNLKCRTCNPHSSISWQTEYKVLEETLPFVQPYPAIQVEWCESEAFWQDLEKHLCNEPRFYINGGEPTLIEAHWNFLEHLVERQRSQNIELFYNSNMTHLPDKAFALWKNFKKVSMSASIDAVGERNHYIRFPASWKKIETHVAKILDHGIALDVTQTISAMNLFYLDEMLAWAQPQKIHVEYNFVYDPPFLAPQALPQAVRKELLQNEKFQALASSRQRLQLEAIANEADSPELWEQFVSYTKTLDQSRKQDFQKTFPELIQCLRKHHYEF